MSDVEASSHDISPLETSLDLSGFQTTVLEHGRLLYRDLPWRRDREPYAVWLSEAMLQQTQVVRVERYWRRWLELFPTIDALAAADVPTVLEAWQGLGYNRRCLALKKAAQIVEERYHGRLPQAHDELIALPGIGPATAAGIRVFAFGEPDVYLETNVRTVFIHELFPDCENVPDSRILPLVEATCPDDDPATWYYALLDYGAYLKRTLPNPSRRSAHHTRQSAFEGSHRQKRAWLLRAVMSASASDPASTESLVCSLSEAEREQGRDATDPDEVVSILADLESEGFIRHVDIADEPHWTVG